SQRIRDILTGQGLPPVGYRVCTLHKLASDILHQRSDLAGVEEGFPIIDEAETQRMMHNAADVWISEHRALWESFLPQQNGEEPSAYLLNQWREETERVGREVTKLCKHLRRTPEQVRELLGEQEVDPFLAMGIDLYALYGQYLRARSGLDFDDLIWRAIEALDQDDTFLRNLQRRWPFILEDEAQDSSPLQEQILERLSAGSGNWVRVGDPNQAINSTFTAADPRYFRRFLTREDVTCLPLPQSGRCAPPIIALANHLVRWACRAHPEPAVRWLAFERQDILPTDEDDPQRNPTAEDSRIYLREEPFPDVETQAAAVARWAVDLSRREPQGTLAILCPATWQGDLVVKTLQALPEEVPLDDLLRSTPRTRSVAHVLAAVLAYLSAPTSSRELANLYAELVQHFGGDETDARRRRRSTLIRSIPPRQLLFPRGVVDLREVMPPGIEAERQDLLALERFSGWVARWVRASSLPVDQLLLTVAQDLFDSEEELAICHTIASSLRGTAEMHPTWRLRNFSDELSEIARNRRRLTGLSLTDAGYVVEPGRIAVTTMHKAKGLEWDTVYLICVDSLEFPETRADDFRSEMAFMGSRAPAVEARHLLERLAGEDGVLPEYSAVDQARLEFIAERLRLLYVGITRARRHLAITYSETNGRRMVRPAAGLIELMAVVKAWAQTREGGRGRLSGEV
ncbi:MAG: ATP-dependent helicase, partial [Chloroflexi bacterium]|nr:ATP-dependent helicase [Chloroflexota bacterium]